MKNNEKNVIKLNDEELALVKKRYFAKLGLENLIENAGGIENCNDTVLEKYGLKAGEYAQVGQDLIEKHLGDGTYENVAKWEVNFDTKEFTVTFK